MENFSYQFLFSNSFQVKAGKEWWVSRKWGLGVAISYRETSLTNGTGTAAEKWNSSRVGILFHATMNLMVK